MVEKNNLAAEMPEMVESLRHGMHELDATNAAEARPAWGKTKPPIRSIL